MLDTKSVSLIKIFSLCMLPCSGATADPDTAENVAYETTAKSSVTIPTTHNPAYESVERERDSSTIMTGSLNK